MTALTTLLALMAGSDEDAAVDDGEEVAQARRDLESALATLRAARGAWTGAETIDVEAIRRALADAERQLDRARVRLQRAEDRTRRT